MKYFTLNPKKTSVGIAKQRLQQLLTSDRLRCSPDVLIQMKEDLFYAISKYIEVVPEEFELNLTRTDIHIRFTGEEK